MGSRRLLIKSDANPGEIGFQSRLGEDLNLTSGSLTV